jgi:hypothetical protein
MTYQTPVGEPSALRAGTTWNWKRVESGDFPIADGWTYTYYLTGKTSLSFAGVNATTDFTVTVAATTTAAVAAGNYAWELRASLSGAVYVVDSGTFDVTADVNVTAASDQRTVAETMLARIDAEIEARITGDGSAHDSYVIGTRQLNKLPMSELRTMRGIFAAKVQAERNGGRLPPYLAWSVRP